MTDYDFVKIFKALADQTRQEILELLGEQEMNVTDICSEFKVSQPTVSHHLHILKDCNLINYRKEGKSVYYYIERDVVNDVFGQVVRKMRIRIIEEEGTHGE